MKKVFNLILIITSLLIFSCGSRKSPTGGPLDAEKPELLSSLPAEFSDIRGSQIELSFSKHLDKSSVTKGLYIYPPIIDKKITVEKNRVLIRINEELLPNTNYFVTLTTRIKDVRGNALAKNQSLVYASGQLQRNRLSGTINYELSSDRGLPVQINLFGPDSLQILSKTLDTSAFAIDELNPSLHIYRAFIDKNLNGIYDFGAEPWAEGRLQVRGIASTEINLAYADTVLAKINSIQPVHNREIRVSFTERVSSLGSVSILKPDGSLLNVTASHLDGEILQIITEPQLAVNYTLVLNQIRDLKGNDNRVVKQVFFGSSSTDTTAPSVTSSVPRNGTSVASLRPELILNFSEIIDPGTVILDLLSADLSQNLSFERLPSSPLQLRIRPSANLTANRSYILRVGKALGDYSGNSMMNNFDLNFLVLMPN